MAKTDRCIFLDFETKSEYSIENGAAAYAAHPSTDILLIGYALEDNYPVCFEPEKEPALLQHLYDYIRLGYTVVAHNVLFEAFIIKFVGQKKYNWPNMQVTQFADTMHLAGRAGLPLSLAQAAEALQSSKKLETGKALIKMFSCPPFILMDSRPMAKKQFMEYCIDDVNASRDIWINLPPFNQEEKEDIALDLKANFYGVPINREAAILIHNTVLKVQANFGRRSTKLTKGVITKMTQVQRLKYWVQREVNDEIPNCAADTIIDILAGKYGDVDETSQQLLEMRQHSGKSSTGKYLRYIHSSVDERILGMIISFGAHTGRTISKLLNLNNLPKPSIEYESMAELIEDLMLNDPRLINEKYGSYLKSASTAIRGIIEAPKGKAFAVSDYAAIEARLVFWAANSRTGLKKYYNDIDMYKDMASYIYGVPYHRIDSDQRWLGKTVILGAGYGLGWKGFISTCDMYGVQVSEKMAKQAIYAYRESYPEVADVWNDIDTKAFLACTTGKITYAAHGRLAFKTMRTKSGVTFLLMKLPSGRFIMYPHVDIRIVKTPWGDKRKAITYKKVTNGGFFRDSTYGGKLFENAIQGIARDCMYYGAKQAQSAGYQMLFTVYDEIVSEIDQEKADIEEFNELICRLPEWGKGIPLVAEGKILKRYQKI